MYLVRWCLILPAYNFESKVTGIYPLHLSELYFFLLVFSAMLIAASGYILNDAFDIEIDSVNKPGRESFANVSSRSTSVNIYIILSSTAIAISFFIAESINNLPLGFVQVAASALLAFYSVQLKKIMLLGNMAVAVLSASIPVLAGLYELSYYPNFSYILIYAGFAFILSLIREIIKDAEDEEGDRAGGRKTLPIVLGISTVKVILCVLILFTAIAGGKLLAAYFYGYEFISFWKLLLCFEIPFALLGILVIFAKTKRQFAILSAVAKAIMFAGILTMLPLWYFFMR
jgi:4-hydroxybenzoate polyprenyltransferase